MDLTLPTTKRYSTFADFLIDMPLSRRAECEQRGKHWKHLQEHCKLLLQKLREKEVSFDPQDYETNELPFVPTFLQYVAEKEWEEESIVLELAIFVLAGETIVCFLFVYCADVCFLYRPRNHGECDELDAVRDGA